MIDLRLLDELLCLRRGFSGVADLRLLVGVFDLRLVFFGLSRLIDLFRFDSRCGFEFLWSCSNFTRSLQSLSVGQISVRGVSIV